jgi:hypothetical protein
VKSGPYRTPEEPGKLCCDPFRRGCVKPATYVIKHRGILWKWREDQLMCDECISAFFKDAGLMG